MPKLGRVTKFKMLFLVVVFVFNFDLLTFSAAILEKGLLSSYCLLTNHINPRGSDCRSNKASVSWVCNSQICREMQVNEMHALYDKHHSVLFPKKSHQNIHNSVKYEVIWKWHFVMLINKEHWISLACISGRKWTEGLFKQTTVYLLLLLSSRPATYIKLLNNFFYYPR